LQFLIIDQTGRGRSCRNPYRKGYIGIKMGVPAKIRKGLPGGSRKITDINANIA